MLDLLNLERLSIHVHTKEESMRRQAFNWGTIIIDLKQILISWQKLKDTQGLVDQLYNTD